MDEINQRGEQARMFFEHHVSPEVTVPLFIAMPIGLIVVGLGLAVLGAKMAKPALAIAFTLAGIVGGGLVLGAATGVAPGIGMLIGGLVCGVCGYLLHRLWVGLAAAVLISAVKPDESRFNIPVDRPGRASPCWIARLTTWRTLRSSLTVI